MINKRDASDMVVELADEGILSYRDIMIMALKWMSEDDIADMLASNGIDLEEEFECADLYSFD